MAFLLYEWLVLLTRILVLYLIGGRTTTVSMLCTEYMWAHIIKLFVYRFVVDWLTGADGKELVPRLDWISPLIPITKGTCVLPSPPPIDNYYLIIR